MKAQDIGSPRMKQVKCKALICIYVALGSSATLEASANSTIDIVSQPTNQISLIFGSAMFSVTAESSQPLSYQWIFDGEPIANATNADLILGPLNCAQSGYYNVIVSNATEAVSSSKAQLTVYQTVVSSGSTNAQNFLLQFTNVMVATVGSFTVYALNSDGALVGYDMIEPALNIPNGLSGVVAISAGITDVVALRGDGTVAAWGSGATYVPGGLLDVTAVSTGGYDNIALQSNGIVVELGYASSPSPPPIIDVVAVAAGAAQFLELRADGTVAEWAESEGQPQPQQVPGLTNVIAIAAGSGSLALKADGTVAGWDGLTPNPLPNVSNVVAIAMNPAAGSSFLALKSDGTVATSPPSLSFPLALSNVFAIAVSSSLGGIAMVSNGAPVFTLQPVNQYPTNGINTAWLHARAVGVQPMSYQWQLDGTNLPNATNADLTMNNAPGTYSYSVLASNNLGSALSHPALVTIRTNRPIQVPYTLAQALDATNLTWSTFGNAAWFPEISVTHDGIAAAQSGGIANSMYSELETTVHGPGTLTFWWKVSSEEYFDFLSFYIGAETTNTASISGEVDWEQETFLIGPGSQTLSWIYAKDPDVSVGQDAGWVDQISFIPILTPAQLGIPTLMSDSSLSFSVYATNGSVLTLSDPSSVLFEASSDLVTWIPLTNSLILSNGSALLQDPNATNSPARFYRLLRQ
jgi:hypothetical protein